MRSTWLQPADLGGCAPGAGVHVHSRPHCFSLVSGKVMTPIKAGPQLERGCTSLPANISSHWLEVAREIVTSILASFYFRGSSLHGAGPEPNVGPDYPTKSQTMKTTLHEKEMHTVVQSQCDPHPFPSPVVTSLNIVKSSRTFWGTVPNEGQQQLLNNALDVSKCKDELLITVYNTTLNRSDLWCLGLGRDVEGTILNCCLKVVETIAKSQNVNVFSASSHQIEKWPDRTLKDQLLHLPLDENIDWFIFPTWIPGHWMVCKHCTNHVSWALA